MKTIRKFLTGFLVHSKVNLVNIAGYRRTRGVPQSIAEHKHR